MFPTINRIESRINSASIETAPTATYKYNSVPFSNLIEKNLQSVLRPLNLLQAIFVCSKYQIRDNYIYPNGFTYNFIGVTCTLSIRVYFFYCWFSTFVGFGEGLNKFLNFTAIYNNFFYSFGFIITYYCNIGFRRKNVLLILRINHAIKLLNVNGKELTGLKIYNWCSVVCANGVSLATVGIFLCVFPELGYFNILLSYHVVIFDANFMYASFVMRLLCKLLAVWVEDVRRADSVTDSERECYWKIKYDVYVDIMEAYKLVEITFRPLIAYNIVHTASHGLINIATVLKMQSTMAQHIVLFSLLILISQIWLMKSILIGISLSVQCERFYNAVGNVQSAVTPFMYSMRCSDKHTLSVCKNIQRIQKASFKKLNACGLFIVDAMMSVRLFSFITTYTIVLIQFEFL